MSKLFSWKTGTGAYMGDDHSTYFVTDEAGGLIMVFAVGGTVGQGGTTRNISQRSGRLIVETLYLVGEDGPLPEIVLEPGMKGWWEPSGTEVFTAVKPVSNEARPREERHSRPSYAPVTKEPSKTPTEVLAVAEPGAASGPLELPTEGHEVVDRLLRNYTVCRGPAGIVLLCTPTKVIIPDESPAIFGGYLQPPHRFAFLRALRNSPQTTQLEEVLYTKFPETGYVRDLRHDNRRSWYWCTNDQKTFICPLADGLRFSFVVQRGFGWEMAINNSRVAPKSVVGMVGTAEYVYPRARSNSDFELVVHCPRGGSRVLTFLTLGFESEIAGAHKGLAVVSYRLTHTASGTLFMDVADRPEHKPPYIVAFDTKGKARIFRKP